MTEQTTTEHAAEDTTAACPQCGEHAMTYNEYTHSAGTHGTYVCHAAACDYYHRVVIK